MRSESPCSARRALTGHTTPIVLASAIAVACFAAGGARAAVSGAIRGIAPGAASVLALEEQSLPPEDLSSPAASPAASPAPPAGAQSPGGAAGVAQPGSGDTAASQAAGAKPAPNGQASPQAGEEGPGDVSGGDASSGGGGEGWTRVPNGAPGDAAPSGAASGATGAAARAKPAGAGTPAVSAGVPAPAGQAPAQPAPEASPTDAPPPYDVGSVQPTPPISDQPLTTLIASTKDQPAFNASLRATEDGRKALEASKLDEAIRELGRAVSIDPSDPYAYFYLGRAYMTKRDFQQALAFFGRAEVGVGTVPAWLGEVKSFEGACLEEQGKFPEAAAAYKQALDAAPGNLMARTGYGRLSASLSDANAGNAPPPPAPADGAALPAPEVNLAAPAPAEAAPPAPQSNDADPGASSDSESGADAGGSSDADSSGGAAGANNAKSASGNQ